VPGLARGGARRPPAAAAGAHRGAVVDDLEPGPLGPAELAVGVRGHRRHDRRHLGRRRAGDERAGRRAGGRAGRRRAASRGAGTRQVGHLVHDEVLAEEDQLAEGLRPRGACAGRGQRSGAALCWPVAAGWGDSPPAAAAGAAGAGVVDTAREMASMRAAIRRADGGGSPEQGQQLKQHQEQQRQFPQQNDRVLTFSLIWLR
jgi:hypothetical protein